ncbi:MAG TPA: glycosyltransferase family 4 protein [Acidimicrobiales bacterium]
MTGVIHLIQPQPPGSIGGADLHIADLAEAQREHGETVPRVLAIGNDDYTDLVRARGVAASTASGVGDLVGRLGAVLARQPGPAVVHSHGYEGDFAAARSRLARHRTADGRRPVYVATAHGWVRTGPRLRTKTVVDHGCLRLFDAVITSCPRESERLARRPGLPPVRFVANGVRVPAPTDRRVLRDRLGVAPDRRVVGFVGRLAPEKRPDLFVDMAARLVPDHGDVHFALFGGGPDLAATGRRVERRDLGHRVHVAGYWPDAAAILSGLDLLVCCSDAEGTPRAVIEAMAYGIPVVATRVGGVGTLVADGLTGRLVPRGDAAAAARAVAALLADPATAARYGAAGRERVAQQFTLERMRAAVAAVYAETQARARKG